MATIETIESIRAAALRLQPDARAELAHALVESLSGLSEAEVSELWLAEAERRDAEMESGAVTGVPGPEVFRRIRALHGA
jgi:putative addiction module component (TIGR02574 family)